MLWLCGSMGAIFIRWKVLEFLDADVAKLDKSECSTSDIVLCVVFAVMLECDWLFSGDAGHS